MFKFKFNLGINTNSVTIFTDEKWEQEDSCDTTIGYFVDCDGIT